MRQIEVRVAVDYMHACVDQSFTRIIVFLFAIATLWIEHDPYVHATVLCVDHGLEKGGIGEEEHFDTNRLRGLGNGIEDRLCGVVG